MKEIKQTLLRLQKNLDTLREREARYAGSAPLDLLNQIEDHRQAIALTGQAHNGEINGNEWHTQMQPLLVSLRLEQPGPPGPVELAVAEQRYRAALKAAFATEADAYIPQTVEATEVTPAPQPRPKLSPRAAQRLRRRAGAEYAKLVQQGQEPKRVKLNTLREAVDQYDCIILLGAPGSGKTTSLENLAYQLADETKRIPLPLRLSEFGPGQSLDDFIRRSWGGAATAGYWGEPLLASHLDDYLAAGKLFILFDALNEMPQQGYKQRVADLRRFIDRWTKAGNRFIVTCRVLNYSDEDLTGLQRVEVLPFTDDQIQTLLQNELPDDWQALWKELNKDKWTKHRQPLLELACNPYLLTMMIDVYGWEGELSRNRAELMERFTTILLEWAKAKVPPEQWIKTEAQQRALAALAFEMQVKAGSGARVDAADVIDALPSEIKPGPAWPSEPTPPDRILTLAASANLIEMPVDRSSIRFYHQLLHEYFSARYVVYNSCHDVLMKHLTDDRWREVFLLTASLADVGDDFFAKFRKALDSLIGSDPALVDLLNWANRKSEDTPIAPDQTTGLKAYYIFLDRTIGRTHGLDRKLIIDLVINRVFDLAGTEDLTNTYGLDLPLSDELEIAHDIDYVQIRALHHDLALALDMDLVHIRIGACDLDYARNLTYDLARASDLDFALDQALELALNLALTLDIDYCPVHSLARALDYAHDLALHLGPGPAVDYLLTIAKLAVEVIEELHKFDGIHALVSKFSVWFDVVRQEVEQVSPQLASNLSTLIVPDPIDPQTTWRDFNLQLRQEMIVHRDLGHEWDLSEKQANTLADYLKANLLLLECLKMTSVDDRDAIKDSQRLPPGEWEF